MRYMLLSFLPAVIASDALASCIDTEPNVQQIIQIPGVWIENLVFRSTGGNLLLTTIGESKIYSVNPFEEYPEPKVIAEIEGVNGLSGIVEIGKDFFAIAGGNYTEKPQNNTMKLSLLKFENDTMYTGTVFEESEYGPVNGIVPLPEYKQIVLGADSVRGEILRMNMTSGNITGIIRDKELTTIADGPFGFGVNGIDIFENYLYFTNSARQTFGRFMIDVLGNKVGDVEIIYRAEKGSLSAPDDFVMDNNGTAYVAFWQDKLVKITPDGNATVLSEGLLAGPTSVTFNKNGKSVFVVTAGKNNDEVSGGQLVEVWCARY